MTRTNKLLFLLPLLLLAFSVNTGYAQKAVPAQKDIRTDTDRNTLETARLFLKAEKYVKAIQYYDLLLDKFKSSEQECSWGLYERSLCYYKMKKYPEARKGFESIKTIYPTAAGPIMLAEKMLSKMEGK